MDEKNISRGFCEVRGAEEEDRVDPAGIHAGECKTDFRVFAKGLGCPALGA